MSPRSSKVLSGVTAAGGPDNPIIEMSFVGIAISRRAGMFGGFAPSSNVTWPLAVAPFEFVITTLPMSSPFTEQRANQIPTAARQVR